MSKMDVHFSSDSNEWSTPQYFFDRLDSIYNFTLDPATDGKNNKCDKFYTKEDDGLKQSWENEVVFCNPPYGRELKHWVEKAYEESKLDDLPIVMLIPSRTDTKYWHDFIFGKGNVYFIKGRLKFGDSNNSAPFPSAVVVYNDSENKLIKNLTKDSK